MATKMSVPKVLPLEAQRGKRTARSIYYVSKYEEKEQQVDSNDSYWYPCKNTPPQVPLITGVTPKQKQADTFKDTIMQTATAIMKTWKCTVRVYCTPVHSMHDQLVERS